MMKILMSLNLISIVSLFLPNVIASDRTINIICPVEVQVQLESSQLFSIDMIVGRKPLIKKEGYIVYTEIRGHYIDGRRDTFYTETINPFILKGLISRQYYIFYYTFDTIYNGLDEETRIDLGIVKVLIGFEEVECTVFSVMNLDECSILLEDELFTYIAINGQYIDGKSDIFYSNDIKYKNLESGIYTFYYIYERIEYIYESLNDALFWKNGMNAKVKMVKSIDYVGALPK